MILFSFRHEPRTRPAVIAGMSGSPIIVDGKAARAVAYAGSSARKPIAGVTPLVDGQLRRRL